MKKASNNKKIKLKKLIWISAFIGLFTQYACYENKSACTDLLAANYDPSSDEACEDCCIYPDVILKLNHVFGNKGIEFKDTISNGTAPFILLDQKIYFADIDIFDGGVALPFIKRSTYTFPEGEEKLFNKIGLILSATPSITINTIRTTNLADSVSLTIGIPNKYNKVNKSLLESTSPLLSGNGLFDTTSVAYASYYINVVGGQNLKDTMSIYLYDDIPFHKAFNPANRLKGLPLYIPITLDYDALFEGIDFKGGKALIEERLKKNLGKFLK
jgi:hypothetical protein